MAFIRVKYFRSSSGEKQFGPYSYLVESYREDGQVKQRHLGYLGTGDLRGQDVSKYTKDLGTTESSQSAKAEKEQKIRERKDQKFYKIMPTDSKPYYTVYHGTVKKNVSSIEEQGLKPPESAKGSSRWFMVTTEKEAAAHFAKGYEGEPVILEYRIPKDKAQEYLWYGSETSYNDVQHAIRKPIPKEFIEKRHPLKGEEKTSITVEATQYRYKSKYRGGTVTKPYVARITGKDEKYGLKREFLTGEDFDKDLTFKRKSTRWDSDFKQGEVIERKSDTGDRAYYMVWEGAGSDVTKNLLYIPSTDQGEYYLGEFTEKPLKERVKIVSKEIDMQSKDPDESGNYQDGLNRFMYFDPKTGKRTEYSGTYFEREKPLPRYKRKNVELIKELESNENIHTRRESKNDVTVYQFAKGNYMYSMRYGRHTEFRKEHLIKSGYEEIKKETFVRNLKSLGTTINDETFMKAVDQSYESSKKLGKMVHVPELTEKIQKETGLSKEQVHEKLYEAYTEKKIDLQPGKGKESLKSPDDSSSFQYMQPRGKLGTTKKSEKPKKHASYLSGFYNEVDYKTEKKEHIFMEIDGIVIEKKGTTTKVKSHDIVADLRAKEVNSIHNHPTEFPPSNNDIFIFLYSGNHKRYSVVTAEGVTYDLTRNSETSSLTWVSKEKLRETKGDEITDSMIQDVNRDYKGSRIRFGKYYNGVYRAHAKKMGYTTQKEANKNSAKIQEKTLHSLADHYKFKVAIQKETPKKEVEIDF